jgi:ferredoxin-NADP reductase
LITNANDVHVAAKTNEVTCIDTTMESYNAMTVSWKCSMDIAYIAGQYATFEFEISPGQKIVRSWTISSSPSMFFDKTLFTITVKRKEGGLASTWIHEHMKRGITWKLLGIEGDFSCLLDKVPSKILMIAGGIGITPLMSMLRDLNRKNLKTDVLLLYSVQSPKEIVFQKELIQMESSNLKIYTTITQLQPQEHWNGLTGRISKEMINSISPDLLNREIYMCGPEGFMQHIRRCLSDLQFPIEKLHQESFNF